MFKYKLYILKPTEIEDFHFNEQLYTYHNFGYGVSPSGDGIVGDVKNISKYYGKTAYTSGAINDRIVPKKRKLPGGDRIIIKYII